MALAVNNSPVSTNYTPPATSVQNNTGVASTSGTGGGGNNVDQGSLSGPGGAGEMAYTAAADLLNQIMAGDSSTDWGALTDSVSAANLGVTVTAIMVLLIEIMAQMKQDAREAALEQAQAALAQGISAAAAMEQAAEDTLAAAQLNAGMQIAMGAVSVIGGVAQGMQLRNFQNSNQLGNPTSTAGNLTRARSDTVTVRPDFTQLQASLQAQTQILNGVTTIGNSSANLAAAGQTFDASMQEAQAQRDRAEGEYQQALGQAEQAFMQQLAEAIKAIMSSLQGVEQAQHQAMGAIYNC